MTRLFGCLQLLLALVQSAPRSKPFLPNADISTLLSESESLSSSGSLRKAYFNSNSTSNSNPYSARLVRIDPQDESCNVKFTLKWKTQLGSAAYSAPIIFSNAEGNKQIFLSAYYRFVEMIHAEDGSKPFSWPVSFESSSFSGSPILYDVDGDGTMDLCVVDKNANMFWIQIGEFGKYNENFHVQVPHLKVRKDWYFNLDVNSTDEQVRLSMFDRRREEGEEGDRVNRKPFAKPDALEIIEQITYPELNKGPLGKRGRRLDEVPVNEEEDEEVDAKHDPITGDHSSPEDDYMASGAYGYEAMKGFHNHRRRFQDDDAAAGFMYGNPQEYSASSGNESSYVFLPPHVLGSPALADVNGDGNIEVIMAVSYYFEKDFHADDIVPSMYIAGGIACW